MLLGLSIRDVVLIDRLDLVFRAGLCVLTGETGAGKSILLDALGLALGRARGMRAGPPRRRAGGGDRRIRAAATAIRRARFWPRRGIAGDGRQPGAAPRGRTPTAAAAPSSTTSRSSIGLLRRAGRDAGRDPGAIRPARLARPRDPSPGARRLWRAASRVARRWRRLGMRWRDKRASAPRQRRLLAQARAPRRISCAMRWPSSTRSSPSRAKKTSLAEERALADEPREADRGPGRALGGACGRARRRARARRGRAPARAAARQGGRAARRGARRRSSGPRSRRARRWPRSKPAARDLGNAARAALEQIEERLFALRALARKHGVAVDDLADAARRDRGQGSRRSRTAATRLEQLARRSGRGAQAYIAAADKVRPAAAAGGEGARRGRDARSCRRSSSTRRGSRRC